MVRTYSFLLGLGLCILWLSGMSSAAPYWYSWLDALAAVCAFFGATIAASVMPAMQIAGPLALALGLFGLWIAGLVVRVPPWQAWWTFVFGVAFAVLGGWAGLGRRATTRPA